MLSALVSDQAFPTIHVCLVAAQPSLEEPLREAL